MVPTFHGDGKLAVLFSRELRARIEKLEDSRKLFVIPCETLNAYLTTSGYKADSALALNDLGALGKQVNASESLDGVVAKTADGEVTATARMYFNNNTASSEPLPAVTGKDAEEAARKIGDEYVAARVQLDGYKKCSNGISDQKYDAAVAGAKEGIAAFPLVAPLPDVLADRVLEYPEHEFRYHDRGLAVHPAPRHHEYGCHGLPRRRVREAS